MGGELIFWLTAGVIVVMALWIILKPHRWGQGDRRNDGGNGFYAADARRRDDEGEVHADDGGDSD
jgi:hypothetical protein